MCLLPWCFQGCFRWWWRMLSSRVAEFWRRRRAVRSPVRAAGVGRASQHSTARGTPGPVVVSHRDPILLAIPLPHRSTPKALGTDQTTNVWPSGIRPTPAPDPARLIFAGAITAESEPEPLIRQSLAADRCTQGCDRSLDRPPRTVTGSAFSPDLNHFHGNVWFGKDVAEVAFENFFRECRLFYSGASQVVCDVLFAPPVGILIELDR